MAGYNKKRSLIKTVAWFMVVLLAIAALASSITALYYGGKNNGWFDKEPSEQTEPDNTETGYVANGLVVNPISTRNINLMSTTVSSDGEVAAVSETAYTLTAVITPIDANNQLVDWSARWANPSSSWATGKAVASYVTVVPTTDGALTATVSCLQAFGEQVIITVTSRDNAEISATCTCDYVKRITGFTFTADDLDFLSSGYNYSIAYSAYTIDSTVALSFSTYMTLTSGFNAAVQARYNELSSNSSAFSFAGRSAMTVDQSKKQITLSGSTFALAFCSYNESDDYDQFEENGYVNSAFKYVASNYSQTQAQFTVTYSAKYGGTTYSSGTVTVDCMFNVSTIYVPVGTLSLSDNSFVF